MNSGDYIQCIILLGTKWGMIWNLNETEEVTFEICLEGVELDLNPH